MSLNSSAVQPPISPHQQQDAGLPTELSPGTTDVVNPSEPVLLNRTTTNSSTELAEEINQPTTPLAEHSAPEKSDRSCTTNSSVLPATKDDPLETVKQAALSGNAEAQFKLGVLYHKGHPGVEKNKAEAFQWYQKAAEQGYSDAQFTLAKMYFEGDDVEFDSSKAFEWFHKAADQDHSKAQYYLSGMYEKGIGVEINKVNAIKWLQKAADQNYSEAQYHLGIMYAKGIDVDVDKVKAFELCHKAAEQGDVFAQRWISRAYQDGVGVSKNLELATYWMLKGWSYYGSAFNLSDEIQLFEFVPRVLRKYPDLQLVNSFSSNTPLNDSTVSTISNFIRSNLNNKSWRIFSRDCLSPSQASVFIEALKFNTELTKFELNTKEAPEEIKSQINSFLTQNKYIEELRDNVKCHQLVYSAGFPLDIVNILVDMMIVSYLKSGISKEATQKAIDEFLVSVSVKALQDDSKIN